MTNAFSLFRSLIIYSICLPLAIVVGYLLATPFDMASYVPICVVLAVLTIPIFLRWHYPLLILSWNMAAGLYFLPGKPSVQLVMIFLSFGFSFLAFILNRNLKFISVPSMTWPVIFLMIVVLGTARLTGGFGLNVLGSEAIGGKRYIFLLSGIVGYFALTARRIPSDKVNLYLKLFFLGSLTSLIGILFTFISPSLYFIFLIFPVDTSLAQTASPDGNNPIVRLTGVAIANISILWLVFARVGFQGVLDSRRFWRFLLVMCLAATTLFGGARSKFIEVVLMFMVLFYLEGMVRSRMLPIILLTALFVGAVVFPFTDKLPSSVQRSLAVLPLVKIDPETERNARDSSEWRLEMWRNVIPTIPQYLILGKGLSLDAHDMEMFSEGMNAGGSSTEGSAMAGDYHNGPLSLIIQFGIPGAIGFIWFLVAGFRVLQRNCHFGDPSLLLINRALFAYFIVKCIMFFAVFGSFYSDFVFFVGPVGLCIALNGGVCSRVVEPVSVPVLNRFKLANATR
jgi:O-Antigen ligase